MIEELLYEQLFYMVKHNILNLVGCQFKMLPTASKIEKPTTSTFLDFKLDNCFLMEYRTYVQRAP